MAEVAEEAQGFRLADSVRVRQLRQRTPSESVDQRGNKLGQEQTKRPESGLRDKPGSAGDSALFVHLFQIGFDCFRLGLHHDIGILGVYRIEDTLPGDRQMLGKRFDRQQ